MFVSEAKQMFEPKHAVRDSMIKAMIEKNRSPHFKFADASKEEVMTSVMHQQYDYKDSKLARGYLDPSIKADLRAHHFNVGYHPNDYLTSALAKAPTD